MPTILVTGGTGVLGRALTQQLTARGHPVRVMSRAPRPATAAEEVEWAQAELETGQGVPAAVAGASTLVHCASSPLTRTQQVDAEGTSRLLDAARSAGVEHFVYISIVGVDRIPYPYYRAKHGAEQVIEGAGVPYTILRATQFHELLDGWLYSLVRFPWVWLPTDLQFQPVDAGEVAGALVNCVAAGPVGRAPDMGGPEVLRSKTIIAQWLAARAMKRPLLHLPMVGGFAAALRRGDNTCPHNRQGTITWAEWLARKYAPMEAGGAIARANTRSGRACRS